MSQHTWIVLERDAIGAWSKRDTPLDAIYFSGVAEKCVDCPAIRFVPSSPNLQPVDCERIHS